MEIQVTLYVADRAANGFMAAADLRNDYKWFIKPKPSVLTLKEGVTPDRNFFMKLIETTYAAFQKGAPYWIPAVNYQQTEHRTERPGVQGTSISHKFYYPPSVKELSDGNGVLFTQGL